MRLQVTDRFFRPLFAFFNTLAEVAEGDSHECDTIADRSLGGATTARSNQRIPDPPVPAPLPLNQVIATPVLGGLHHDYRKTA
jgi:hypothetical protein